MILQCLIELYSIVPSDNIVILCWYFDMQDLYYNFKTFRYFHYLFATQEKVFDNVLFKSLIPYIYKSHNQKNVPRGIHLKNDCNFGVSTFLQRVLYNYLQNNWKKTLFVLYWTIVCWWNIRSRNARSSTHLQVTL